MPALFAGAITDVVKIAKNIPVKITEIKSFTLKQGKIVGK